MAGTEVWTLFQSVVCNVAFEKNNCFHISRNQLTLSSSAIFLGLLAYSVFDISPQINNIQDWGL